MLDFKVVDWVVALREQGYEDKDITDNLVRELQEVFREEQKKELFEGRLDLGDLDGWLHLEKILKVELDKETAIGIINLLWEKGISIMDCGD